MNCFKLRMVFFVLLCVAFAQAQMPNMANSSIQAKRDSVRLARQGLTQKPLATTPTSVTLGSAQPVTPAAAPVVVPLQPLPIPDSVMIPSLNIRDTEIRDLLQGLAVQHGLNLFLSPEVKGPISVQLNRISLKDALQLIISHNGYEYSVDHGVISIRRQSIQVPIEAAPVQSRFVVEWKSNKLTLDIEKAPIEKVVRAVVEATGKNIVVEKGLTGDVTTLVKTLPLGDALQLMARSNGMVLREHSDVFSLSKEAAAMTGDHGATASGQAWVKVNPLDTLVSVEAVSAPLSQVVNEILSQAGVNSMIYGKIDGSVSAKLDHLPIRDALRHLLRGTNYSSWEQGGVYFVGGHEMQTAENSALIRLKHLRAEDVMKLLPQDLLKTIQVQVVKSQNGLMVEGAWETIEAVTQYVEKMDLPVAQILVEALVLDVDIEKAQSYGFSMFIGKPTASSSKEPLYPNIDQTLNRNQSMDVLAKIGLDKVINLPSNFGAQIQAMEQNKVLDVKARSQIATLNGETAVLTIGQTQYFLLKSETDYNQGSAVTNKSTERFEKVEANQTLTVTP